MDAAAQGSSSPQMARPDDDMENENVLMKHVSFFDINNDGIVYPWETFQGFRSIGCGLLLSTISALFINIGLSRKTIPVSTARNAKVTWVDVLIYLDMTDGNGTSSIFFFPAEQGKKSSLLFPIYIENINKCKHGSDSGVYDSEGRFVPAKFEEIFSKHAVTHHDALTGKELNNMLKANREAKDYGGWVASWTEWEILYYLCKDENKLLHKETVRAVYDGTLFHQMAKKKRSSTGDNKRN